MSANRETTPTVEVGPSDIQITESGGVEITNIVLSRALKSALEERKINWPNINLVCPTNWKCGKDAAG